MLKISCIIPAYNEEKRIENVLRAVYNHPLIDELIVVDDASKDGTAEVLKKYKGINFIRHEINRGKSNSVVTGINNSKNDILFFLDADLIGLTAQNVSDLISPVLFGKADIAISLRKNAPGIYRKIGIDFLSGERVFPKKLISEHLDEIKKLPSYGLETFMNGLIIKNRYRIQVVHWDNVLSPWKSWKVGKLRGFWGEIKMNYQILKITSIFGVIQQIVKMSSLRIK